MKVPVRSFYVDAQYAYAHTNIGTFFVLRDSLNEEISMRKIASFTPSPLGPDSLKAGIDKIVSLNSDDLSAGSPFGTGFQTFGAGLGFKRAATIVSSHDLSLKCLYVDLLLV